MYGQWPLAQASFCPASTTSSFTNSPHARHPNHRRTFFCLLGQMMPGWEKRKLALERILAWTGDPIIGTENAKVCVRTCCRTPLAITRPPCARTLRN